MRWFAMALNKYATFSGRSRRSEYWYFVLFYILIYIALAILDSLTGTFSAESSIGLLTGIFSLGMLIPSIAVGVRRLHDTRRSGWWLLISIIPVIGAVVLAVFLVQNSESASNRFGENPKTSHPIIANPGTGAPSAS
jgi:uncharacterized membrane protein YhaH (DUF805 family)